MLALGALLAATGNAYGYHRDEPYFRMLDPAWGYLDQPSWAGLCGTVTVSTPNDGERIANLQFSGGGRGRG